MEGVRQLAKIFRDSGLRDDETLMVRVDPCAVHTESAWAPRLPVALRFLFGW